MNRQKQGAGQEPVRPAGGRDSLYVTSSASFWNANSGERPGVRLPFRGEFQWGGSRWVVPGVYSTEKALVVDLCRQVDPDSVERFLKQWGWTPEIGKNDTRNFTPAEAASIGIIGGAHSVAVVQVKDTPQEETAATAVMKGEDGPAAVLVGVQSQSQGERSTRVALSALRFELAETVTWLPVFSGAVPEALAVKLEKQGSP